MLRCQFTDGVLRQPGADDRIEGRAARVAGARPGEAAADREVASAGEAVSFGLLAQIDERLRVVAVPRIDEFGRVAAKAVGECVTGVREPIEVIEDARLREVIGVFLVGDFVEVADVTVRIDDGRHDGLAGEVHACGSCRHGNVACSADGRDAVVLDHQGAPFDRRAFFGNEAGVFECGDSAGRHLWLLAVRGCVETEGQGADRGDRGRGRYSRLLHETSELS